MSDTEETEEVSVDSENTSLPKWKKLPTITDLKQNLDDADANSNSHVSNVSRWLSNLLITDGAKVKVAKGNSAITPKLIRKQAEWRYSSLSEPFLASPDIFNIYPTTAGDDKRAKQNQLVLNNQFNTQINKVKFIDDYVRDAVDIGTVVCKIGWESEEEEVITEKPIFEYIPEPTGQLAQRYEWLLNLKGSNPEEYLNYDRPGLAEALDMFMQTGQAYIPQETGETETITEIVETKNQATVETLDSRNVVVDPTCMGDYTKAEFIAEKFKSSLAGLKKDGRYINLDQIDIEGNNPISSPDYENDSDNDSFNFNDKPRKQFVVHSYWGMWDINGDGFTKPIVVAWVGNTIIRMEENPFPDKKPPFVIAVYMPVRRSVHGEPDGELLEDNQKIVGAVTRGMIDLMAKSANGQTGVRKDLLDVTNRRKFNRGDDYEFNANVDPKQGIHSHIFPEIPQSAYNMVMMQNNEAESLSGIKAFNSGISGDSLGRSVANGRSALDAASKREVGILRRLAEGITAIGRKIISMNAEFLSEEEVIRVTAEEFVTVRRDDLAGNFDLQLAISTPEEDNKKAEELAFMLQTTGPNSDPGEVRMIRAEIARLRKMPALAKRIEEYKPEPDPLQVAEAELKVELLQAQIAKEQALTAKHNAEAGVNNVREYKEATQGDLNAAKVDTEESKARHLSSDADNKDLAYLEQEAGVHQARELEKIDKKAGNDMNAKILDADLQTNNTKEQ